MAVEISDKEKIKQFLFEDPIHNAMLIRRIFFQENKPIVFADDLQNTKAVAVVLLPDDDEDDYSLALHAKDAEMAENVLQAIPRGKYWIHIADELCLRVLRKHMRMGWFNLAWLLVLRSKKSLKEPPYQVTNVDNKWARKIATIWSSDWDAEEYIKERIENGLSAGICLDDELIAWSLTHFETDDTSALGMLYVHPQYRGRGYAEAVTTHLIKDAMEKGKTPMCHVFEDNLPSIQLYESLGFEKVCKQGWGDGVTL